MADILEFGVKLNVSEGAEAAKSQLKKVVDEIGRGLGITVDFKASASSIEKLKKALGDLENRHIDIVTDEQRAAIQNLTTKLSELVPLLDRIEKASTKQAEEVLKTLSVTTKAALEEERLAQAKERTAQAQAKTTAENAKAETAIAKQLAAQERLNALQAKQSGIARTEDGQSLAVALGEIDEATRKVVESFDMLDKHDISGYFKSVADDFANQDISRYFEDASGKVLDYNKSLKYANSEISRAERLQAKLKEALQEGSISASDFSEYYSKIGQGARTASDAVKILGDNAYDSGKKIEEVNSALDIDPIGEWSDATLDAAKKLASAKEILADFQDQLKVLESQYATHGESDEYISRQAELLASISLAKTEVSEYTKELNNQITAQDTLNGQIEVQKDSLEALTARLKQLSTEWKTVAKSDPKYAQIKNEIDKLRPSVELLRREQGDLAASSRSWGRDVVDLTYAIRVINPTLGIYAQRIQRVSALGKVWNDGLSKLSSKLGVTVSQLTKVGTTALGVGILIGGLIIKSYRKWQERQEAINKTLRDGTHEVLKYQKAISDLSKEINKTGLIGVTSDTDRSQISGILDEVTAILEKNKQINPIIAERVSHITDEKERLLEIKKVWEEIEDAAKDAEEYSYAFAYATKEISGGKLDRKLTKTADAYSRVRVEIEKLKADGTIGEGLNRELLELEKAGASTTEKIEYLIESVNNFKKARSEAGKGTRGYEGLVREADRLERKFTKFTKTANEWVNEVQKSFTSIDGVSIDYSNPDKWGLTPELFAKASQVWNNGLESMYATIGKEWTALDKRLFETAIDRRTNLFTLWSGSGIDRPLTDIQKELANVAGYGEDAARKFSTLSDAVVDVQSKLDANKKLLDEIAIRKLTATDPNAWGEEEKRLNNLNTTYEKYLKKYGDYVASTPERKSDTRQQELMAEVDVIKQATQAYEKLLEVYSSDEAARKVNETYGELIRNFEKLPRDFELRFDGSDVTRALEASLDVGNGYLKKADALKIRIQIQEEDVKNVTDQVKRTIDQINSDIKRQQEANKIFKDILGLGVSQEIAADFTLRTTGKAIENIRKELERSIQEAASEISGLEIPITDAGKIDYSALEQELDGLGEGYDKQKDAIQKLISQLRAYDLETFKSIYSGLDKFQSYEEQKTKILREETERRRQIREDVDIPEEEKESLLLASQAKQAKEVDKLIYDTFKNSELYVQAFDDLDKVSTASLKHIQQELLRLQGSLDNLDPAQLKELQSRLKEIEDAIIERNPFKGLGDDIRTLRDSAVSLKEAQRVALADLAELSQAEEALRQIEAQIDAQHKLIEEMLAGNSATEEEIEAAKELLRVLQEQYDVQQGSVKKADDAAKKSKKRADELQAAYDNIAKKTDEITKRVSEWAGVGRDAIATFEDIADLFGGLDEETQRVVEGIGQIIDGLEQAAEGAAKLAAGIAGSNPIQIVNGAVGLIGGLAKTVGGFLTAFNSKIKKANKEIKRQQEIIDELTKSYKKLNQERDKALGAQSVGLGKQEIKNQQDQIVALQKQIDAERSKGKKKDKDKISEWEKEIENAYDNVRDLTDSLISDMLGSDISRVADQFAQSWIDAYSSASNTFDALNGDYKQLMKDIVKNTIVSDVINKAFQPILRKVTDAVDASGNIDLGKLEDTFTILESELYKIDKSLGTLFSDPRIQNWLGDANSNIEGISKSIASITEDTAIALAGDIGSIKYYSVGQFNELVSIREIVESISNSRIGNGNLIEIQQESLTNQILMNDHLSAINTTTSLLLDRIESVIKYTGNGPSIRID